MKTEFTFPFNSERLFLESAEEIKLRVSWDEPDEANGRQESTAGEALVRIERAQKQESRVTGYVKCTVPGPPEEALPLAKMLVGDLIELLRYLGDDTIRILGLTRGRRIAETEEEQALIGDRPNWMRLSITEVPEPLRLSRSILRLYPYAKPLMLQLRQYNLALSAPNPVDKYLALFKIVESYVAPPRGRTKLYHFTASNQLRELLRAVAVRDSGEGERGLNNAELDDLIEELLVVRHKCAHLRDPGISGYWPTHPEIGRTVEGLAEVLSSVVRESIARSFRRDCPEIAGAIDGGFYL